MIRALTTFLASLLAVGALTAGDAAGVPRDTAGAGVSMAAYGSPATLTLEQALGAALDRASAEDARVELAYGQFHYLESQRKWKIEFRPNLGMLAFSNPAVLATNIGAGFLFQRFNRPDAQAMRGAEFDVLAAEVSRERQRLHTKVETARAFFTLLERQAAEDGARGLWDRRNVGRERMVEMLKASRVTVQDQTLFEIGLSELESEVIEAEARRKTAAVRLANLIGYTGRVRDIRITGEEMPEQWRRATLEDDALIELALTERGETRVLRDRLAELPPGPSVDSRFRVDNIFAGYSYISDSVGAKLGTNSTGFLLGGHTGRTDLGFAVNLRETGEKAASKEINAARRQVLELELSAVEDAIRAEVETVWYMADASRRKLQLAARKRDLRRRMLDGVKVRAEHGLTTPSSVLIAEMEVLKQESEFTKALSDRRTREFHLMAVCGVTDRAATAAKTGD